MYRAIEAIYFALDSVDDLEILASDTLETSEVWVLCELPNDEAYSIRFISFSNENDVSVRVLALLNVPEEKRDAFAVLLNKLNDDYRFVRFACDEDGDVNIAYDFLVDSNPACGAQEIVTRMQAIVQETYPQMKLLLDK